MLLLWLLYTNAGHDTSVSAFEFQCVLIRVHFYPIVNGSCFFLFQAKLFVLYFIKVVHIKCTESEMIEQRKP